MRPDGEKPQLYSLSVVYRSSKYSCTEDVGDADGRADEVGGSLESDTDH
jgi:hypothetical protein